MYRKLDKYLSDIKVTFQVISNYAIEFICRVERGFSTFCGDLKIDARSTGSTDSLTWWTIKGDC